MKRLLLAGGGQAQLFALSELAGNAPRDVEITLVTPNAELLYSAMLPGWIAGHYTRAEFAISLPPLARAANARLVIDRVVGIDPANRVVRTDGGETIEFDLLSLATGSAIGSEAIAGAQQHALALRPINAFVDAWTVWGPELAEADRPTIVVIGAGAGGLEVSLAIAYAMRAAGNGTQVKLVTGGSLLPGHSDRARTLAHRALMKLQVRVFDSIATQISNDHVELHEGTPLTSDLTILVGGPVPPHWLRDTGLALDDNGFVAGARRPPADSHARGFVG